MAADPAPARLLVVEDEAALRETLAYNLKRQGYEVLTAANGQSALELARRERPDALILDVMLPGIDGLEVCRLVRRDMAVPILMLTARADEIDKVVGLEIGADDYMTKPFSMRELLARVRALLRRVQLDREQAQPAGGSTSERLVMGDLAIDTVRREVERAGRVLRLNPKEYDLLLFLARHRGAVLSREQLLEQVWGWDYAGGTRTVDVHLHWLRAKIEPDPGNPVRLVTVRGAGYRFEG